MVQAWEYCTCILARILPTNRRRRYRYLVTLITGLILQASSACQVGDSYPVNTADTADQDHVTSVSTGVDHFESTAMAADMRAADMRAADMRPRTPEKVDTCEQPIMYFADGRHEGEICPDDARERGLTIVDLSDDWTPLLFTPSDAGDAPSYRQTFLDLANEYIRPPPTEASKRLRRRKASRSRSPSHRDIEMQLAQNDRYFELYGIFPSFSVLAMRLSDSERLACYERADKLDASAGLQANLRRIFQEDISEARNKNQQMRVLRTRLERAQKRHGYDNLQELAGKSRHYQRSVDRLLAHEARIGAITATQAHLVCSGLLNERYYRGVFDWRTSNALKRYQRKHFLIGRGILDAETRALVAAGGRELAVRAVLRSLRERVVDATGIIEDGTAGNQGGTVLGHALDPAPMRAAIGHEPLPEAAPDLVSEATSAAAHHLGWTDFAAIDKFFRTYGFRGSDNTGTHAAVALPSIDESPTLTTVLPTSKKRVPQAAAAIDMPPSQAPLAAIAPSQYVSMRVALPLPQPPTYHRVADGSQQLDVRIEIDRGDIWYDASPKRRRAERRPALVLYAKVGEHDDGSAKEVALLRWSTTIGGWQKERLKSGRIVNRFKDSDVGPRLWRDLFAAPSWYPPASTPDDELVAHVGKGQYRLKRESFGPSYRSAYGLAMFIHHVDAKYLGEGVLGDRGVRTHGSANFPSIARGSSHGCHRLFNHHAIRLASFMLRHRQHVRHGEETRRYQRAVHHQGSAYTLRLTTRGFRYEFTPPIPVRVTRGRILSKRQRPLH